MNNSLAEVHPELVSEWSEENLPLIHYDISFGSNEKVWWKGFIPYSKNGSLFASKWNKSFTKPLFLMIATLAGHGKRKYKFKITQKLDL